jgi:hypothetical protein
MKNWKIGTRIAAGFGVVLAITAALGTFAYVGSLNSRHSEALIAEDYLPSVTALSSINRNQYAQVDLLVRHAAATTDAEEDALEAQMNALKDENNKHFQDYEATPSNDEEPALYA